ncbi:hypothetical protein AVEN_87095-1 [Araneus ventricosus]|uniref:Uncharacterized protein n=1 Tax=Araneus ventricosus TaxID=182803 RepID=A0A4Y2VGS3_ARAVE|nr:hypothetical protein AVEN_87095-1 [Araneus ventricosus]
MFVLWKTSNKHIIFDKEGSTIIHAILKYIRTFSGYFVITFYNQGKTLCSPYILSQLSCFETAVNKSIERINDLDYLFLPCFLSRSVCSERPRPRRSHLCPAPKGQSMLATKAAICVCGQLIVLCIGFMLASESKNSLHQGHEEERDSAHMLCLLWGILCGRRGIKT